MPPAAQVNKRSAQKNDPHRAAPEHPEVMMSLSQQSTDIFIAGALTAEVLGSGNKGLHNRTGVYRMYTVQDLTGDRLSDVRIITLLTVCI